MFYFPPTRFRVKLSNNEQSEYINLHKVQTDVIFGMIYQYLTWFELFLFFLHATKYKILSWFLSTLPPIEYTLNISLFPNKTEKTSRSCNGTGSSRRMV